ncbi:MAG: amylo-alpha-1,6-glucosidase [Anaerohalosphaeraceae bacterium]|nr:amylo-alpha-1,6-glucosidase [Anaerohalosphaeraceae bacterium]
MLIAKEKEKLSQTSRFEKMIQKEWLLTNSRGNFASGTICGSNSRRYHSMLTGSLQPPGQRTTSLCGCDEKIYCNGTEYKLSHFEFEPDSKTPKEPLPERFRKDIGVHFDYSMGQCEMTKSIFLAADSDITAIVYEFKEVEEPFEFSIRPLTTLRDFHSLGKACDNLYVDWTDDMPAVKNKLMPNQQLILVSDEMAFVEEQNWWYNFAYRMEKQRGFDHTEDLFSPGVFHRTINGPVKIVLWAGFGGEDLPEKMAGLDIDIICDDLRLRHKQLLSEAKSADENVQALTIAANAFIIERQLEDTRTKSILAGFPWFLDWGRDSMIALPGLLLSSKRYEDAAAVLINFALSTDEGMIPNCFDDYNRGAAYNSIDASLWFVHAAFEYYKQSGDMRGFSSKLMPVIRWVIDSYRQGTKFGIHADTDGLIVGGDRDTQLTWMDAKSDGKACTPRWGKAVEINALWYNAICNAAEFYAKKDPVTARNFSELAEKIADSFKDIFWNERDRYLYDCINDGSAGPDEAIRPNQIFAVSLPFSPLTSEQQRCVVETVRKELLTPYGLRTLSPNDARYRGRYQGTPNERDSAYHQGTVWPWLIGGFIEAYLKVNNNSKAAKKEAAAMLSPLLEHLKEDGCIGNISEIFDGDKPQKPRGTFAQAWSVSEVLRAYLLVNS